MPARATQIRCSIKAYVYPFLKELGDDLGTDDLSEIVNHALIEYRRVLKGGDRTSLQSPQMLAPSRTQPSDTAAMEDSLANLIG